jgi:hypothetical protein
LNGKSNVQHPFHALAVGFANQCTVYELSHPLSRFFGKDMTGMAMAAHDFACCGNFKTLCCTPACLLLHGYLSQI